LAALAGVLVFTGQSDAWRCREDFSAHAGSA